MRNLRSISSLLFAVSAIIGIGLLPARLANAHCDGLDGPVVKAAMGALAKGDVNLALIWVQKDDEAEIRRAFEHTMNVRKLGPQAKELADMYFFEVLVRVHRAGEGAPYTGLKPAGRDLGPAIPAADKALESGDVVPLTNLLVENVRTGLLSRYEKVKAAKSYRDVATGRDYVDAYVAYIHYVEGLYETATSHASGHYPEPPSVRHDHK